MCSKGMEFTYKEVASKIDNVACKFWKCYGGDLEYLKAEARFHFIKAYGNYALEWETPFENYVSFYVWKQLLETTRTEAKRKARLGRRHDAYEIDIASQSNTLVENLVQELSDDARYVVRLITSPDGLPDVLQSKNYLGVRKNLKKFLITEGWTTNRVDHVFQEIGDAL